MDSAALAAKFQSEMTADQLSCIDAIQQTFVRMGRESWTDDAVSNSLEWKKNPSLINHNFRIVPLVTLEKKSASPARVTDCPIVDRQMFVVSAILCNGCNLFGGI